MASDVSRSWRMEARRQVFNVFKTIPDCSLSQFVTGVVAAIFNYIYIYIYLEKYPDTYL